MDPFLISLEVQFVALVEEQFFLKDVYIPVYDLNNQLLAVYQ